MQRIAGIANLLCPVPSRLSTLANAYQIGMPLYRTNCGALHWQTHALFDTISAQQPVVQQCRSSKATGFPSFTLIHHQLELLHDHICIEYLGNSSIPLLYRTM